MPDPAAPASPRAPPPFLAGAPWATRAVLAVVVAVSALSFTTPALFEALLKDNDQIRAGQWWRLATPALVHGHWLHLAMNGIFLLDLGSLVEKLFGSRKMLAVLWGSVVTGTLASFLVNPAPSVGISGGLFGLVGAMLAQGLRHWRRLAPGGRRLFLRAPIEIVILNVALGFAWRGIDNAAHLGGLAGGLLLGSLLGLSPQMERMLAGAPETRSRDPG